jgi:hypothetical protein
MFIYLKWEKSRFDIVLALVQLLPCTLKHEQNTYT